MIFFKHSLITFTTLIVAVWVMPVTSVLSPKDAVLEHKNPLISYLRGMK